MAPSLHSYANKNHFHTKSFEVQSNSEMAYFLCKNNSSFGPDLTESSDLTWMVKIIKIMFLLIFTMYFRTVLEKLSFLTFPLIMFL